jgi:hypothetical protein
MVVASLICYVGPGGALSAIAAFAALLAAAVLAAFGFVWYPVKRLLRALRRRPPEARDLPGARSSGP